MPPHAYLRQRRLVELFDRSPVQATLCTTLAYGGDGEAEVTFPSNPSFDNALSTTHGGILATLLDTAGWFAAAAFYDTWIATVDLHVQLLAPSSAQVLTAIGRTTHAGGKIAMATMSVVRPDGETIAVGRGTFSVTRVPFQ